MLVETVFDTANAKVRLREKKISYISIWHTTLNKLNIVFERDISYCLLNM